MRALIVWAILVGVIGQLTACIQAPGTQAAESEVDFSGTYVRDNPLDINTTSRPTTFPFTAEGERGYHSYADPNLIDDCTAESFPSLIFIGLPMQIVQDEGSIEMRFENWNTIRTIHMDGASPPAGQPHTETGYSTGRWEGTTLRIDTTHLVEGTLTGQGQPMSREARLTERYWRYPGAKDLRLELLVDDPVNYTQTVVLGRGFVWSEDEQLRPWGECVRLGPRGSEPDIDELARMLEEL